MSWYFAFFLLSGFCSILYELVWLRLTMAQYGVTTALVSITLSMFMLGMGAGSWGAGVFVRRQGLKGRVPLRLYGLTEFLIGCSALLVPAELVLGHRLLESFVGNAAMSSATYYLGSGALVALTLLPWCFCMGATYPLAMAAIEGDARNEAGRSFSYLYVSNVIGALGGAILPLLLIEERGFHGTLRVGSLLNALIAGSALGLSFAVPKANGGAQPSAQNGVATHPAAGTIALFLLFLTGLSTMGMEVIWTRLFTPYAGPFVYSFASILGSYLAATFVGSALYRGLKRASGQDSRLAWVALAVVGLLPLLTGDPRFQINAFLRAFAGIALFAMLIGFLTPMLVDRWSGGDPDRAGRAYAVNVLGCLVGPLLSGFVLLPLFGEHISMLVYVLPWIAMAFLPYGSARVSTGARVAGYAMIAASLATFFLTKDFETIYPQRVVLRDSTATVIATGVGMDKRLITNGVGMTRPTPITKIMAHLALASLQNQPRSVLVICFGMGTTHRSAISWGIPVTSVELVPSVPKLFTYYHSDGDRILASPLSRVVIDDGRRFLERSPKRFDAIIIDPPPPINASASSLLYSEDFYGLAKKRLAEGGILVQWVPQALDSDRAAAAKALKDSFPYVRVYGSIEGWGYHFLASMQPIPERTAEELVARMPPYAVADLMEWGPMATPVAELQAVLAKETSLDSLIARSPDTPAVTDDRPSTEYYLLRNLSAAKQREGHGN